MNTCIDCKEYFLGIEHPITLSKLNELRTIRLLIAIGATYEAEQVGQFTPYEMSDIENHTHIKITLPDGRVGRGQVLASVLEYLYPPES